MYILELLSMKKELMITLEYFNSDRHVKIILSIRAKKKQIYQISLLINDFFIGHWFNVHRVHVFINAKKMMLQNSSYFL